MCNIRTTITLDDEVKEESIRILKELGFSLSGAIEVYLRAVIREKGIPFDLKLRKGLSEAPDPAKEEGFEGHLVSEFIEDIEDIETAGKAMQP